MLSVAKEVKHAKFTAFRWDNKVKRSAKSRNYLTRFLLIAALCLPININDYVFTVFGNAVSKKSVISIASLYQKADKDTIAILFAGYQNAGRDARVCIGIAGYQRVGKQTRTFAMFSQLKNK